MGFDSLEERRERIPSRRRRRRRRKVGAEVKKWTRAGGEWVAPSPKERERNKKRGEMQTKGRVLKMLDYEREERADMMSHVDLEMRQR